MSLPFKPDFIPLKRRGAEALVNSVEDVDQLSQEQIAAIRELYRLDDPRTIKQLILDEVIL